MATPYSPETLARIAQLRQKCVEGTASREDMVEAVKLLRQDRKSAATASDASRRRTAKAVIPSADDMLSELAAGGVSLLLTTHHLEEAEARCARTVIIDHGRVIASGTLTELVDRTVGRHRLVSLRLDTPIDAPALAAMGNGHRLEADAADSRLVRVSLRDVGAELPALLTRIHAAGRTVEDVEVRGPSLQAVFIHLTGRELRE